ncbi:MAG: c-type cytochrome [Gammaproteobacteria bacterium]|nr:c-type cytochrome [Gammaproteobacteria bacterium]
MSRPTLPVTRALLIALWLASAGPVALAQQPVLNETDTILPETTFERFAPLAEAGDPEVQHFLGYMYFYGEGVELDLDKAHYWFHIAAEEGELKSMRNLGLFHARGIHGIPRKYYDPREANLWFSLAAANAHDGQRSSVAIANYENFLAEDTGKLLKSTPPHEIGKTVYATFCAGCHGFDGHSSYPLAPSFALGESLDKTDALLVRNIGRPLNDRPHPVDDIPRSTLFATLGYIRNELSAKSTPTQLSASLLVTQSAPPGIDRKQVKLGETIYLKICGGCHGFNGISTYVNSPSFALGERMHKSDAELASSIRNGRGEMPSWEFMLKPPEIDALVSFVRTFEQAYASGIDNRLRPVPDRYFRFTPKSRLGPGDFHNLPTED